jgi:hypothetical protein
LDRLESVWNRYGKWLESAHTILTGGQEVCARIRRGVKAEPGVRGWYQEVVCARMACKPDSVTAW